MRTPFEYTNEFLLAGVARVIADAERYKKERDQALRRLTLRLEHGDERDTSEDWAFLKAVATEDSRQAEAVNTILEKARRP